MMKDAQGEEIQKNREKGRIYGKRNTLGVRYHNSNMLQHVMVGRWVVMD